MAKELNADKMSVLQDAMGRASKLMQLEANGTLDKIAKGKINAIGNDLLNEGEMNAASLMTTQVKRNHMPIGKQSNGVAASSVLPAAITESFKNNPIDETALYSAFGGGGNTDLDFLTENIQRPTPQKTQEDVSSIVNEGLGTKQTSNIDYPMIRTIVEDVVRKYAQSLNKRIINEGKQNVNEINTIALGKTFKFLASDGSIFECTMKKIGNINDKKRGVVN